MVNFSYILQIRIDDRIFGKYLSFGGTHKLGNESSESVSVTERVKFVFRPYCSILCITQILSETNFAEFSLEFQGLSIDSLFVHNRDNCSPRIHSLVFRKCTLSDKAFRDTITFCINLSSLELHEADENAMKSLSIGVLDYVVENAI